MSLNQGSCIVISDNDSDYVPTPMKRQRTKGSKVEGPVKRVRKKKNSEVSDSTIVLDDTADSQIKQEFKQQLPVAAKRKSPHAKKQNMSTATPAKAKPVKKAVKRLGAGQSKVTKAATPRKRNPVKRKSLPRATTPSKKRKITPKKSTSSSVESSLKTTQVKQELPYLSSDEVVDVDEVAGNLSIRCVRDNITVHWSVDEVVAAKTGIPLTVVQNVVKLLEKDCTVPFISRYRREELGQLGAGGVQKIYEEYINMAQVCERAKSILKTLEKNNKLTDDICTEIGRAKSLETLEAIYFPLKESGGRTFAERAKALGLEESADAILTGQYAPCATDFIKAGVAGLKNKREVEEGWVHIISAKLARHRTLIDLIETVASSGDIYIETSKARQQQKHTNILPNGKRRHDADKFTRYFGFRKSICYLQHHEVMAINRGEEQKVLSVKLDLSHRVKKSLMDSLRQVAFESNPPSNILYILDRAIREAYERFVEPRLCRHVRSQLTSKAEKASVDLFSANLRELLLTGPVRGRAVLGIDPGITHGCKCALVSKQGKLEAYDIIYPHTKSGDPDALDKIAALLRDFECDLIAIGNGTACRETEELIAHGIATGAFLPLQVQYVIVDESGASIWSVTPDAEEEYPDLDANVRSAASLAKRLQDPLLEYVKVEPKHLGVGQYQHDVSESLLKKSLDSVVVECVSFVGVDLNVSPQAVLRRVSGLSAALAKNIVEHRKVNGPFLNREQLLKVKRIGPKTYEQCAGFVKIYPETALSDVAEVEEASILVTKVNFRGKLISEDLNPLDMTIIHPESYHIAKRIIEESLRLRVKDVGTTEFVRQVAQSSISPDALAKEYNVSLETVQLILNALQQPKHHDIRCGSDSEPVFKSAVRRFKDLRAGQLLSGVVRNVTAFGTFIDVGLKNSALLPSSMYPKHLLRDRPFRIGQRVQVIVVNLDNKSEKLSVRLAA